jgi:hypothetical protein
VSILWVHEALSSGSGVGEHDGGNSYTRVFDVLTDDFDDNAITVSAATDPSTGLAIPSPYDYFDKGNDTDYQSVVTRISPERDARYALLWHVTVEYTVIAANTSDGKWPSGVLNIIYRLPEIRIWGIAIAELMEKDINGNPIANSAGMPFDPPPEDVRYIKAIEITTWIRTYNLAAWAPYEDSTNATSVWGCDPETVLMVGPPSGTRKVDRVGTYYEIKAEFHWDPKGWDIEREDRGRVQLANDHGTAPSPSDPATGTVPITDNAGIAVNEEVPLDGNGRKLVFGQARVYKKYTIKGPADWTALSLPSLNVTF